MAKRDVEVTRLFLRGRSEEAIEILAAPNLEKWLKNPTWDNWPEELDSALDDYMESARWEDLIDNTLPRLRKGHKRTLDFLKDNKQYWGNLTEEQVKAIFYAIERGFKQDDVRSFLASFFLLPDFDVFVEDLPKGLAEELSIVFGELSFDSIEPLCHRLEMPGSHWGSTGWVVPGQIYFPPNMKRLPQFEKVEGDFFCANNKLTSLEGAPREVGGGFYCNGNRLKSLKGAPEKVGGAFNCSGNPLRNLKGGPLVVGGDYTCTSCGLTSLQGAPKTLSRGSFICQDNNLTDLTGAPKKVKSSFDCDENKLRTLKGAPEEVGDSFLCNNNELTTLEGAPKEVGGAFWCRLNPLESLEALLDSDIGSSVISNWGEITSWPPPEGTKLTAAKEKEAASLETWLKNPDWDNMPPEVEDDLEDDVLSELWVNLIDNTLPALRKGNKHVIPYGQALQHYTELQKQAIAYAMEYKFDIPTLLKTELDNLDSGGEYLLFPSIMGIVFGRTVSDAPEDVQVDRVKELRKLLIEQAKGTWTPKGWDCKGSVKFTESRKNWPYLPPLWRVEGDFICNSASFKSLEGSPREVKGDCILTRCALTRLKGGPDTVGGFFDCSGNKLRNLKGGPSKVGFTYNCSANELLSLEGAPREVHGPFICSHNKLQTLKGAPDKVKVFNCENNHLSKDLVGGPSKVEGAYYCGDNFLTSLKGAPKKLGNSFNCQNNALKSLQYGPEEVKEDYLCIGNPLEDFTHLPKKVEGAFIGDQLVVPKGSWNEAYIEKYKPKSASVSTLKESESSAKVERWLKSPTWDWMPPEIDKDLEDNFKAEVWTMLLDDVLPEIRKGNQKGIKKALAWLDQQSVSYWQKQTVLYAAESSLSENDYMTFLASYILSWDRNSSAGAKLILSPTVIKPSVREKLLGVALDTKGYYAIRTAKKVAEALQRADCHWSTKGWVARKSLILDDNDITQLPQFEEAKSDLACDNCKLTTLKGAPRRVGGSFYCSDNKLKTLEGCPKVIVDSFQCNNNKLTSLKGCPNNIKYLQCHGNQLTSLEGAPSTLPGALFCTENKLRTLKGCPRYIGKSFDCSKNALTDLKGGPEYVGGAYLCQKNNLESLEGAPKEVAWSFDCTQNDSLASQGLEALHPLLDTNVGNRVHADVQTFTTWPPEDPTLITGTVTKEANWFKNPNYDNPPKRIEKILDESSVRQERWYNIIDDIVPALRKGKERVLDYILSTLGQYDDDQIAVLLYATKQGFGKAGAVKLAANHLTHAPPGSWHEKAIEIAEDVFGAPKRGKLLDVIQAFKGAEYTDEGWVVPGALKLGSLGLTRLPPIKSVGENLEIYENQLTSLKGCPRKVPGDFNAGNNRLKTLEGSPDWVRYDFYCQGNFLKNLKGGPKYVGEDVFCYGNPLESLEGKPKHLGGMIIDQ